MKKNKSIETFIKSSFQKIEKQEPTIHYYNLGKSDVKAQDMSLIVRQINKNEKEEGSKDSQEVLLRIQLRHNVLGDLGCKSISTANWTNLVTIDLNNTKIGELGCKYLSRASWRQLKYISLRINLIGDKGCKHLSKAHWPALQKINMWKNDIKARGCKELSKTHWFSLQFCGLGTFVLSEGATVYSRRVASIYQKLNGFFCSKYGCVLIEVYSADGDRQSWKQVLGGGEWKVYCNGNK